MKIHRPVYCALIVLGVVSFVKVVPAQTSSSPTQTAADNGMFTATVTRSEAKFTLPAPTQKVFRWRQAVTNDNEQEYRMSVKVTNATRRYDFGFYLWKRHGATSQSGGLADLINAGQKSVFERVQTGMSQIIHDAEVNVKVKDGSVIITVRGKDDVARLFSGRPAEVTFEIKIPGEPLVSRNVTVLYK